jgi:hypothetical protein
LYRPAGCGRQPARHLSAQSGKRKSKPTSKSGIRGKGGNSDTLACITGGIAEAFYRMPQELRDETLKRLPDEMQEMYELFRQNLERRM